ncbi:ribonuclease H-like domain-containing protein [Tanacetum coccineum]
MSAKDKNGLGYGTQLDEMSNKSETDSEISMSVFKVRSSDEEIILANDRFSKVDGYNVVPPPITGNFLTPRADISFAGVLTRTGLVNPVRTNGKRAVHTVSTARPISTARLAIQEIVSQDHAAGGYNPKGCKITSKGKIRTANLDFDDVYFVDELKSPCFKLLRKSCCLRDPRQMVCTVGFKDHCSFCEALKNTIEHKVISLESDNGTELRNHAMNELCAKKGIKREFSMARTPQQNGKPPSISFMRPFGCPLTILNTLDPLGKFDGKSDEGYLLGYSTTSKAFRDLEDVAKKEEQHMLTEADQALQDDLERMIPQEISAKTMDDATRQAFEEEKKRAS